jgi:N-sulfoglucosamine sulfohydrolase
VLFRSYGDKKTPVLPNCDDGLSKKYWIDHGWKEKQMPEEELYDLVFDPNERNNLVSDPSFRDVLKKIRTRLDLTMKNTGDPLISGYIAAPPDAILNNADDLSPKDKTYAASELYDFNRKIR